MTFRLTQIDDLVRGQHYHLEEDDLCYFFGEYTARRGATHSATNQLIMNLKKGNDRRGRPEYRYKGQAIDDVARMVNSSFGGAIANYTFVPVPPSKCRTDAAYDDRMAAVLRKVHELNPALDFRELVWQKSSTVASHEAANNRPTVDAIMENYRLDEALIPGVKQNIIVFDDVLTAGCHFRAMKRFLLRYFPQASVLGLFVARTAREADIASLFDLLD